MDALNFSITGSVLPENRPPQSLAPSPLLSLAAAILLAQRRETEKLEQEGAVCTCQCPVITGVLKQGPSSASHQL